MKPGLERLAAAVGIVLIASALAAHQGWLDRHFLPSFLMPRAWYVAIESLVRAGFVAVGLALLIARSRFAALIARTPGTTLRVVIAAVLALGASELVLRRVHLQPAEWLVPDEEPQRRADARLGWTLVPARVGHGRIGGRTIDYALDAHGYRVASVDAPVDFAQPTLVFVGESVVFGEGLTWEESLPAQVGVKLGLQSANLAVHGFGTDQMLLKLQTELPQFNHPRAVIALFMTTLFGRNLDDDRPHLGPDLEWKPEVSHGRLASLGKLIVPFRRDATVERGITMTRKAFIAMAALARAHGAVPLIVVPQFGSEAEIDRTIRERVLDEGHLPYVRVQLDTGWRLPWDRHPNAYAARVMAEAVASRLQSSVVSRQSSVVSRQSTVHSRQSTVGQSSVIAH